VRRTPRIRTLITAGAVLFLAGTNLTTSAPPATAAGPVRVMQFNICAADCNRGVFDKVGGGNDVVEDVRARILTFRPAIVALNEVCVAQFNRLKSLLDGGTWRMNGVFRAQRNEGRCKGGAGFGDAVFSAAGIAGQKVLALPNAGSSEHRAVLCARTSAGGGPVLACVLHLVTRDPLKGRQLAAAARAANAEAGQGAVILGGDFNVTPGRMGSLLDAGKGGRFFDVDPQLASTRGGKIDYVLFSRAHFTGPSGGPQGSKYSDHDALIGQATRR
jgi:endonuclease/exonuclease/phosphatase family metal-dependent hydrolase